MQRKRSKLWSWKNRNFVTIRQFHTSFIGAKCIGRGAGAGAGNREKRNQLNDLFFVVFEARCIGRGASCGAGKVVIL